MKSRPILFLMLAVCLAAVIDFSFFLDRITRPAPRIPDGVEGIAVLTGARERIGVAARLLDEGKAHRLLISGVNEKINLADVLRIDPALERLAQCCVDIGRKATNTIGNAQEINAWAKQHTYHRIVLVTSDYHMPRALLEVQHANPTLTVAIWPVASTHGGGLPKFSDTSLWRLIVSEWLKGHVVSLRIAFGLPLADND